MYHKLKEKPTVFFDVDNTLVFAESDLTREQLYKFEGYTYHIIRGIRFYTHEVHVEKIKEFKARGHNVVVWSAGGSDWAEEVVNALEIAEHVDLITEKPRWYFDDKHVTEWMKDLCYVNF